VSVRQGLFFLARNGFQKWALVSLFLTRAFFGCENLLKNCILAKKSGQMARNENKSGQ
jgi:hypothetical protein